MPIGAGLKHPDLPAWQDAATTDPAVIASWYTERPGRGVGVATGHGSGLFVLDVDLAPGGDDTLADLEAAHEPLPATVEAVTGSGGRHLYFRYPDGVELGNSAGRLGRGLDIRANGGQVLAPPTVHPSTGRQYEWEVNNGPDDVAVADAPPWLLELLVEEPKGERPPPIDVSAEFAKAVRAIDRFNLAPHAQVVVETLLCERGWTHDHVDAKGVIYLTRPGKDRREGTSATIGALEKPGALRCFTSSWPPLQAETSYDPFDLLTLLVHGGDAELAEVDLVAAGWGEPTTPVPEVTTLGPISKPAATTGGFFVDWHDFMAREHASEDWLLEPLLARGRAHAIYAGHKTGKSLMLLWAAAKLATGDDPVVVIYLDYEMSEDDLHDRLLDMGHDNPATLQRLRYALLPMLPPLDSVAGGDALLAIVDAEQAAWPDHHVAVVIDTTSRAVSGEENSADTIRAFYRETGIKLKQRGCTWVRVDHAGKDAAKGQRGSSAKGDDVDLVWLVDARENGDLRLVRKASRMGWVKPEVTMGRTESPLAYTAGEGDGYPQGTKECVDALDRLGVDPSLGRGKAGAALRDAGHKCGSDVLRAALKARREPRPLTVVSGPGQVSGQVADPQSGQVGPRV